MTTKERDKLHGADSAIVFTEELVGGQKQRLGTFVRKGEELPENLAKGELDRLKEAGLLDPTAKTHREQVHARRERIREAGLVPDTTGTVMPTENRPETPALNAPPSGTTPAHQAATVAPAGGEGTSLDPRPFSDVEGTSLAEFNQDAAIQFIKARPADEVDHWLEEERQGKARVKVLGAFGASTT